MESSDEFEGALYRNTAGYFEKYFSQAKYDVASVRSAHDAATAGTADHELQDFIKTKSRSSLLRWLSQADPKSKSKATKQFVSYEPLDSNGIEAIALVSETTVHPIHPRTILALGLVSHDSSVDGALSKFCDTVKYVFAQRPLRLFMHAFRICDATVEFWTFDRAGGYCGLAFDVVNQSNAFQVLLRTYLCMNDVDLGMNPVVSEDANTITLRLMDTASQHEALDLSLDTTPLATPETLLGPGTSCFKGHDVLDRHFAVKFEWSKSTENGEWTLLETARAKGVEGVVKLVARQMLCSTVSLRQGLIFSEPYTTIHAHEKEQHGPQESEQDSAFEDLTLNCIVTSPLGQALDTFDTPKQLLGVLRDVVHALRSLYLEGDIIHRDISPQNIVIVRTDPINASSAVAGMLIDLNLALDLSQTNQDLIGSEGFMAIGILCGHDHTYRHDLEAVFYVFLWMAICHDGTQSTRIPHGSRLHGWMGMKWFEVLQRKRADMELDVFHKFVEAEFSQVFRPYLPLAYQLHGLLFRPRDDEKLFIKTDQTDSGTRQLYAAMSEAFARAME